MPPPAGPRAAASASPLDRARRKAYRRLLPICFISYVIAFVDRANVSIAKLTMTRELPGFDNAVIGFGAGIFFLGYFLLEIPGTLLVEKWSARLWIARIMITWGVMAALTATVRTPFDFYLVRFLLGLAEAGFFPGVIVYLTHWFPSRDRARALAFFFVATPVAQLVSPKISNLLLRIGTDEVVAGVLVHHPKVLGLSGWQWVYVGWGIPAVVMGVVVLFFLTDRPRAGPVAVARRAGGPRGRARAGEGGRVREAPDEARRGPAPPQGAPARARVLPLGDGQLRRRVLHAQHPRAVVLPQVRHPHLAHPPAAAPRPRRPAARGLELGPDEGAAAAHGRPAGRRRPRPPGRRAEPWPSPAHRRLLHGRLRRLQVLPARVLGDAEPLPHRGRRPPAASASSTRSATSGASWGPGCSAAWRR